LSRRDLILCPFLMGLDAFSLDVPYKRNQTWLEH
jgi:hypothetical protein